MKAVVIGAGIAGLSCAAGLARHGVEVDVVEVNGPEEHTGAGITLLGNALRALGELSLAEPCFDVGFGFDVIDIVDGEGSVLMSERPPRTFHPDRAASLGIIRSALHGVLAASASASGARLHYDCTVASLVQDDDGVDVTLSTGQQMRADLVVAADGTYSPTRTSVFGPEFAPEYVGQGAWRITFQRPEHLCGLVLMRNEHGQAGGAIPLSDELCYVFTLETTAARVRMHDDQLPELMAERLAAFAAPLMRAAAAEIAPGNVSYRPFDIQLVPTPWHRGRVVLIGDAAHSLTPQMTSGGGLALEDAVVLARLVGTGRPVPEVLAAFDDARFGRVQRVYDASLQICRWEQQTQYDRSLMAKLMGETHAFMARAF